MGPGLGACLSISATEEVTMNGVADVSPSSAATRMPQNKGKLIGAKPPLRPKHVRSIRTKLQVDGRLPDLVMFDLATPPGRISSRRTAADRQRRLRKGGM
jgi:hypothetical protein